MIMKQLKLPITGKIKPTPGSPVNIGSAYKNLQAAQANGQKIISATLGIEVQLETIITYHVFGKFGPEVAFFSNHILAADWFSFSSKRKLVLTIVKERNCLKGENKNRFEKLLRDIMSYRNAFAHGAIVEKSDGTYISYFENTQQERLLSDDYWTQVENIFQEALEKLMLVQKRMGIKTTTFQPG
jgi:hypothetical protein